MFIVQSCADMTYDCIYGRSPVYFRDICSSIVSVPFRSQLRSADNDDMIVPRTTARYGPRSFRDAAPQIWNMLLPLLKNSSVGREQFESRLGFLCKPTHKRRLWELCLSGALQIDWLTDWLIDWSLMGVWILTPCVIYTSAPNWRTGTVRLQLVRRVHCGQLR